MRFHSAALFETDRDPHCHFGITETLLGTTLAGFLAEGAGALGVGAETAGVLGGLGQGAIFGAGIGAGGAALTGGDPLTGALTGGITGGAVGGFGPAVGSALGIGNVGGDILTGAAAGAFGSEVTGGNPLSGALTGGAGGAITGLTSGVGQPGAATPGTDISPAPATGMGGGTSAMATAGVSPGGINVEPLSGMAAPAGDLTATGAGGTPVSDTFGLGGDTPFGDFSARPAGSGGVTGDFSPRPEAPGIGSKIMGLAERNPGILLGGGLLAANMLMGDKPVPAQAQLERAAGEAGTEARTLAAYQQSGTLPPGLQSIVDQQVDAAKAAITSQYGHLGLSNSTMMTDKLNQLKQQKSAEVAQFADSLAKQGLQWANMSAAELGQLMQAETQQQNQFTQSLGLFAGGLAGLRGSSSTTTT